MSKRTRGWLDATWPALLVLAGCASVQGKKAEVDDTWLARLPESELQEVNQLRTQKVQLQDDVTRARVQVQDAQKQLEIAKTDADAVQSRVAADEQAVELARSRGDPQAIQQAQKSLDATRSRLEAAKARVGYREKGLEAARAQQTLAERRVDTQDAQISMAEFQALRRSGDPRVQQLSEGAFQDALQRAQTAESQARETVTRRQQEAQKAQVAWQNLQDQAPALGGSGPQQEQEPQDPSRPQQQQQQEPPQQQQ